MASIIKNRILKHLSKFTKNLSADRINVSTLKGEGELTDLQLDENVLTDLLELPVWIRLSKATCNRVSCKIMWTKLKSVPIFLNLDEVLVEMETCEELRQHSTQNTVPNYSSGGKYGFTDKVIDGMTVTINNVIINFKSIAFQASFNLSRLRLDSRTPLWQKSDLRMTRVKEPDLGLLLIFKQVEWQTLRVEATALELNDQFQTPLRIITNQARCRITIKKRLADCAVLGSRLVFVMDELLWVVTDSQLKAAMHFADSLAGLVQRATKMSHRTKAARKLESLPDWVIQGGSANQSTSSRSHYGSSSAVDSALARVFSTYDVHETSYHFCSGQIDLHFCDDATPDGVTSCHPSLSDGGAIQLTLENMSIDYYPYHLTSGSRKFWLRYKESSTNRSSWVSSLLADFRQRLLEILPGESPRAHTPVHRAQQTESGASVKHQQQRMQQPFSRTTINAYLNKMMSVCVVVRVEDFTVYSVSTPTAKSGPPNKCMSSDKGRLLLPHDMAAVHLEWTQFYYPGDSNLPVPPNNLFVQMNPFFLNFDPVTVLWLNAFLLSLHKAQMKFQQTPTAPPAKVDVRLEALMPRIVFVDSKLHPDQPDRPRKLQIQVSRLTVTNSRLGDAVGRLDLGKCLEHLQNGELFFGSTFPSMAEDPHPIINAFVQHAMSSDRTSANSETDGNVTQKRSSSSGGGHDADVRELYDQMHKELLKQEEKKVWSVHMDPVWAEFIPMANTKLNKPRPIPFLDAFPLTLWIHQVPKEKPTDLSGGDLHILLHVQNLVNIQLSHYQYLFLLRTLEALDEMNKQLVTDTSKMMGYPVTESPLTCMATLIPELDLSLVMEIVQEVDVDESLRGSINSDDIHYRRTNLDTGVKESTSECINLTVHEDNNNLKKSCSDSLIGSRSANDDSPESSSSKDPLASKTEEGDRDTDDIMATNLPSNMQSGKERRPSSSDWSQLEKVPDNLSKSIASGSSAVKKGFSNLMSSIDSAFSSSKASLERSKPWANSSDDGQSMEDWETISVRSDMSSDSDQFLMVHLENQTSKLEDALFSGSPQTKSKVEQAKEMKEDTPTTPSSTSVKRLDLVTALTLRLGRVQISQNSRGYDSVTRVVSSQLMTECNDAATWDEFQTKFSARSRGWQEAFSGLSLHPCDLRLRYEIGPTAETKCPTAGERGYLVGIVSGANASLLMSCVVGLADLFEDEIIPLPMPLRLYLKDINIHFQEDRPPTNASSPGPVPVDLSFEKLCLHRLSDGIFHLKAIDDDIELLLSSLPIPAVPAATTVAAATTATAATFAYSAASTSFSLPRQTKKTMKNSSTVTDAVDSDSYHSSDELREENEQLKLKLGVLNALQTENNKLKDELAMETTKVASALHRISQMEEELANVQAEKKSLLTTHQFLQQELRAMESRHTSFNTHNATG